jgi:hypothetical protein
MAFIVENSKMDGAIPFLEKMIVEYSTQLLDSIMFLYMLEIREE